MSDCLKAWGTLREALEIIAAARNVSIEESLGLFCSAWNNGLKVRFYQTTRNPLTLELAAWQEIRPILLPQVTPHSFATGNLSQLKQWLPTTIAGVFQQWVGMQSHCGSDDVVYWTSPRPAGCVPGDQRLQSFEVDLDIVRAAFLVPPSPPETESAPSPSGTEAIGTFKNYNLLPPISDDAHREAIATVQPGSVCPKSKDIRKATRAIIQALKRNPNLIRSEAFALLPKGLSMKEWKFREQVWPPARLEAGLPEKASSGRPKIATKSAALKRPPI
jgi:hypothetical protein